VIARGLGRWTNTQNDHSSLTTAHRAVSLPSPRAVITHNRTERQTTKHTCKHTHKNPSLVLATVPWCRYHLGHCSLFDVFWPKVGGASDISEIVSPQVRKYWSRLLGSGNISPTSSKQFQVMSSIPVAGIFLIQNFSEKFRRFIVCNIILCNCNLQMWPTDKVV